MTALGKDRKTDQLGTPDIVDPQLLSFPVAAATTIYGGSMVATDASGNAVPVTAVGALRLWGRCERQVINTVAAGFGSAGDLDVTVRQGVFAFTNGTGVNAITAADVGKLCYASDDQTVNKTDGAGLWPAAGKIFGLSPAGEVYVGVGMPSLYDEDDDPVLTNYAVRNLRARNVVVANVADLTAFTVAGNDGVTNVAGDVVLLVAQSTAAQNGLYQVGTVTTGTAPLTRIGAATGETILSGQIKVSVGAGTLFGNSEWKNTTASGVVGTNDLAFYPGRVVSERVLVAGTVTISDIPILSATKTQFSINRKVANTSTATTGGYATNGAPTPGAIGTASAAVFATVAAGTINNADISTLEVTVINW